MQTVRRLVPNFIIEKYKANELSGSFEGAAVFVDLVGFSNMVDALSVHGQPGAEALAGLMSQVFEPLVNAVYEQGGFVIGYAGDAFNAVFPADQAQGTEAQRCLAALVTMQAHMASHSEYSTSFGNFHITLKTGMGYGKMRWQMFTSKGGKHLTYWMRGDALNRAVFSETRASAGDIITEPFALEKISKVVEVEDTDGAFRVTKILSALPDLGEISEPIPDISPMNIFFSEALLLQPVAGEFRQVINLFIDIPVNISDEALMTPFMQTVYALQEKYGGFFLRPELGDKGFNLLMIWGAPTARERDLERALDFLLELANRTKQALRAGITYRTAYAGFMGAPLREDYTVYGWGITFAARLMTYANTGEFWIDEEIARRAEEKFDVQYLGEHPIKGFSKNQRVYQLLGKKSNIETIYQGEFIGREEETKALISFIKPTRLGKFSGLMLINGEAGIGKSRLVHAFKNSLHIKNYPSNWFALQTEELVRSAFNPFKAWLKKRFEITENESNVKNWNRFMRILDEIAAATPDPELASELERTASVLAALADLPHPDSLYESLDAKSRYENTFLALSALLRAESLQLPTIIFLEDAHWLDDDTAAFLDYLIRILQADENRQYPIAIIASQRPEKDNPLLAKNASAHIEVGKLSSQNLHSLAKEILGKPITNELGTLLHKRAEGNPFYAEQILRYLSDSDSLTLGANKTYTTSESALNSIPLDVNAVLIARLDRLTQKVRETVQTASVLGREFVVDILVEMLQYQLEKLPSYVQEAEQAKIWAHLSEIEYIFSHALLRDAAYSMQLAVRQQNLHALAFSAIQQIHHENLSSYYGELAYHAEKGNLDKEAPHYLKLAGNAAKNAYQNRQAIDFFTRALALLPEDALRERFDLLIKRVECLYNIGDSIAQLSDLEEMERLAGKLDDDSLLAQTLMRSAHRYSATGDYEKTIRSTIQAKELAQTAQADTVLMSAYIVLPDALSHTGKSDEARQLAEEGLAYAQKTNNRAGEAHTSMALGLAVLELEGPSAAQKHQERALLLAKAEKDHYLEGKALNNLANAVGLAQGDYHAARDYFLQALSVFQEQGNQTGKGLVLANLGWVAGILGDYAAAMAYYEHSLKITRALGHTLEEVYTYINLSASANGQGAVKDAITRAEKALDFAIATKDRMAEHWAYFYLAHARLLEEEFKLAKEAFIECIKIRKEVNSAETLVIEARAGLSQAYAKLKEKEAAFKEAEEVHSYMEKDPTFEGAEEPLRIYLSLHTIFVDQEDARSQNVLNNANRLLEEQVSKLNSEKAQRIFVENVPWRKAIKEKAES